VSDHTCEIRFRKTDEFRRLHTPCYGVPLTFNMKNVCKSQVEIDFK